MNVFKKLLYSLIKKNRYLNQEYYAKIYYEYYHDRKLDLGNPVDYNQKIQWLKVFYHPPILNVLADKYAVREYVKEKIGKKYLNELFGVYEKSKDLDFEQLPNQFVLKATHGSHMNIVVKDKTKLNTFKAKVQMNVWLMKNLYYNGGQEWVYKDIQPRLIAEKYLAEIGRNGMIDYRFFCFSGEPKFIQLDIWEDKDCYRCHYDLAWNRLSLMTERDIMYQDEVKKPEKLDEMIKIAQTLSDKHPFVRVDLYSIENRILFGELTFYPSDARKNFIPEAMNKTIGDYIVLPPIPKGQSEITVNL